MTSITNKLITVKTPSGKHVTISVSEDLQALVTINDTGIVNCITDLRICFANFGDFGKRAYIKIQDGRFVALSNDEDRQKIIDLKIEIDKAKIEKLEITIPGYQVLMDAYKVRAWEIEKEHNALEKSYDTSIYHGDGGAAVKAAEKKVKDLEQQYPVATAYIYYTNYASKCAGLDSGYQAKLAAQALVEGKSIEEAEKIANNWDKWI